MGRTGSVAVAPLDARGIAAPIEELIKAQAYGLGFDLAGITSLDAVATAQQFERWLESGFHADMHYMERGREKRRDSRLPVAGARNAIVVAMNYGGTQPPGPIARYARGRDYHKVMEKKLRLLHRWLQETTGHPIPGKPYVDTGPVLERDLARKAGIGWFGKNTNLINPRLGSFFFIGTLLVDLDLRSDAPFEADRCGSCTRCIEACPTGAIVEPGVLDSRRCISYLTIENRGPIPEPLRESLGDLIYGCDICQDVCPWNERFAQDLTEQALAPDETLTQPDLVSLLFLTDAGFRERFAESPIKRTRRAGLARNIVLALGNRRHPGDIAALDTVRRSDPDATVREHADWVLEHL